MEELNYEIDESQIENIMKKSLEYYNYIDVMGEKLSNIITNKIEPFLQEGKFDEAKKMVRDFYYNSRHIYNDNTEGDTIFIEYDLIMASKNKKIKNYN
jgi:hypothetical protein